MRPTRFAIAVAALLLPLALVACPAKKPVDEIPSAQPVVTAPAAPSASAAPVVVVPEVPDAGPVDAASDAAKPVGHGSSLAGCCAIIAQNMKSAPPEQQGMYAMALAACRSGAIPPQFRTIPGCK